MSTDLIELLKGQVSPLVVSADDANAFEKEQVLSQFYPIFLTLLKSKPHFIESLSQQLNPKLSALFDGNTSLKEQFLEQFGSSLPLSSTEQTLEKAISPTIRTLKDEAGSGTSESVVHLIHQNTAEINQYLPVWAAPILESMGIPLLRDKEMPLYHSENEHPTEVSEVEEEMGKRSWIPFIILLLLTLIALFLYKQCREPNSEKPVSNVNTVSTQPAVFELDTSNEGGLVTCQMYLDNLQYVEILQKEVKQIFSSTQGCGVATDGRYHTEFVDQDIIPTVLKSIQGTPNVSLRWVGNEVSIQAKNPADAERISNEIRSLAQNLTIVGSQTTKPQAMDELSTSEAISTANSDAERALASIKTDNVRALDIATALNMQIINFETASTDIPAVNQSILDQAAALMQRAAHVNLKVIGHTDAQGDATANKTLSQQRAQAVVDYLVKKGVDPAQLQATGMGQEQPRADNMTEEGRFKNRRIEFEVLNTQTGTVRSVDEQGVQAQ